MITSIERRGFTLTHPSPLRERVQLPPSLWRESNYIFFLPPLVGGR
jgi:hypothetical protein